MINAAMVGLGWWGRYIVGRFSGENESQHLRFRRVVDIDAAAAQGFADDHGLESGSAPGSPGGIGGPLRCW